MATRNARTNGKSAGDNGKRPAPSAGPDIPRRGSNLLADPTPGPGLGGPTPWLTLPGTWLGDPGRRRGQNRFFFFLLFPKEKSEKNAKKKKQKKAKKREKTAIWEDPPFQTRGSPQVSSHLHHLPGWSSQICKVSPNLAKVHVPRRLVTIRGILFHLQAPKVG